MSDKSQLATHMIPIEAESLEAQIASDDAPGWFRKEVSADHAYEKKLLMRQVVIVLALALLAVLRNLLLT